MDATKNLVNAMMPYIPDKHDHLENHVDSDLILKNNKVLQPLNLHSFNN